MCAAIPTRGCQCPWITVLTWPGLSNQNAAAQGSRGWRVEEVTGHSRGRLAVKENSHLARAWSCFLISNASQAGPCQHQHLSVQADQVLSYRGTSKVTPAETRVLRWLYLTCPHLGCVYDGRAVSLQMSMSVQPQEPTVLYAHCWPQLYWSSFSTRTVSSMCPCHAQTMRVVKTTRLYGNLQTEAAGTGRKGRAPHTGLFQVSGCVL